MKKILETYLPKFLFMYIRTINFRAKLYFRFLVDAERYFANSRTIDFDSESKLIGIIIAYYHMLEKGLAMPNRRDIFGVNAAYQLLDLLFLFDKKYPNSSNKQFKVAVGVLKAYEYELSENLPQDLRNRIKKITNKFNDISINCGYIEIKREKYLENISGEFKKMITSRKSIRSYTSDSIDAEIINEAVNLAKFSPSVCNRQSSKVYHIHDKKIIEKCLMYQNGNRGFGQLVDKLLVVTSDLSVFEGIAERNQAFIDGGLFSMSLLYSLTSLKLGACPLNWCASSANDNLLRKSLNIPLNEVVIMLISCGHIPEKFNVPASQRKDLSEILVNVKK